jgi:hypothetical protein
MRRITPSGLRAAERREREDNAKRLRELVPELRELTLKIAERHEGSMEPEVVYRRYIVVGRAPAFLELPCSNRRCDGGHDLTRQVMRALRAHRTQFTGHHTCSGHCDAGDCDLELRFEAEASYQA